SSVSPPARRRSPCSFDRGHRRRLPADRGRRRSRSRGTSSRLRSPRRASRLSLAGYFVAFTIAYTRIGAAIGALLLFGAVQVTMIGIGIARGERPRRIDWLGMALAGSGLLVLTLPGAS